MANGVINWLRRFKSGDPTRLTAGAEQQTRIANILNNISGVGCRVEKPLDKEGRDWKIIVDGTSDTELPEDWVSPFDPFELDQLSLDFNDDDAAQIWEWDTAGNSSDIGLSACLFPYQDDAGGRLLKYVSGETLLDFIENEIEIPAGNLPLDYDSLDESTIGGLVQLYEWEEAETNNSGAAAITSESLIPCKRYNGATFDIDLVYYTVAEITGSAGDFWGLGGTYATAYGGSIGSDVSTKVIDLTSRTLTGGLWNADAGVDVVKGAASEAGRFTDSNSETSIADGSNAISTDGIIEVDGSPNGAAFNAENGAVYAVGGITVVSAQGAAVADATDAASAITQLNALLAELRASTGHGLIA